MRTCARIDVWTCCWLVGFAACAEGAEFSLKPIKATGGVGTSHTLVGTDEIRLTGVPQRVFIELQLKNWGPSTLKAYQASIDGASYSSGASGTITPAMEPCCTGADPECDCECECAVAFEDQTPVCIDRPPQLCEAGFINKTRSDYVFNVSGRQSSPAVDNSSPVGAYRYFSVVSVGSPVPDPLVAKYGGHLILDVPTGATGTFTIGFLNEQGANFMYNINNDEIQPLLLTPVKIVIQCGGPADCNDGNGCTNDVCSSGVCSNNLNYDPATHCCNQANGDLQVLSDGNPCTKDVCDNVCDPVCGGVTHPPEANGFSCGDAQNYVCDKPDSCDGAGNCNARVDPAGTPCGSSFDDDCDNPDTCSGTGRVCLDNFSNNTTPCNGGCAVSGGPCDDPDLCNGNGLCLCNPKPDNFPCSTNQFCIGGESCQSAACTNGTPTNCADQLTCTTDSCNEDSNQCDRPLDAGKCLIDGVCYSAGDTRPTIGQVPGNTCEHCDPSTPESQVIWTVKPNGSDCDDGNACTGTPNQGPEDQDLCTGGVCEGEPDPQCNDTCIAAVMARAGEPNLTNNGGAGPVDDGEALCQQDSNHDVWFKYTAVCNGSVFVSTTGSALAPSNDTILSIHSACPTPTNSFEMACDDDSGVGLQSALNFSANAGLTYLIRVAGFEDNVGPIVVNLRPVDACSIVPPGSTDPDCWAAGAINPENDCQACIPLLSSTQWSPRPEGSSCGNILDTECDSPDACDGAGVCEVNHKPDGILCSNEVGDCEKDLCPICTKNFCQSGVCVHPPEDAGLACGDQNDDDCDNPNTCNGGGGCANNIEQAGHACGSQDDPQCDNPNTCDGIHSVADDGCLDNFEVDGAPCDDADICTGDDECDGVGGCLGIPAIEPPLVEGIGSRYLQVTPQASFVAAEVALHVTAPNFSCLDDYISADWRLVPPAQKVFKLPSEWGVIKVNDPDMYPGTVYHVEAECGAYRSAPGIGSTYKWGDVNNDGVVDGTDITKVIDVFKMYGTSPFEAVSLAPCVLDGVIDGSDIVAVVDAFKLLPYRCSIPCH